MQKRGAHGEMVPQNSEGLWLEKPIGSGQGSSNGIPLSVCRSQPFGPANKKRACHTLGSSPTTADCSLTTRNRSRLSKSGDSE
ncbi:MAG: hypothetical protein Q9200_001389 [Gallowayella weberi]